MIDLKLEIIAVRPCVKCEATERDKSGKCRACSRAMAKAWYAANKDRAKASMLAWHKNNPEKSKAGQLAWAKANPDKIKAYSKLRRDKPEAKVARAEYYQANMDKFKASSDVWRLENPHELRIHQQNSRARDLGREGHLSRGLVSQLLEKQQGICPCCQTHLGEDFQIDHIISLHNGGLNVDANAHLLRAYCNASKGPRNFDVFMQSKGTV